jgi:hypothetical protein
MEREKNPLPPILTEFVLLTILIGEGEIRSYVSYFDFLLFHFVPPLTVVSCNTP